MRYRHADQTVKNRFPSWFRMCENISKFHERDKKTFTSDLV